MSDIEGKAQRYWEHYCQARHRTYQELARCIWPGARVTGEGPFAAVSKCGATAVTLGPSLYAANSFAYPDCGKGCRGAHRAVQLPDPKTARTGTRR